MLATISGTLKYKGDKMAELRYRAGKIRDPGVHKIGIIALGSHLENHGPALQSIRMQKLEPTSHFRHHFKQERNF